MFFHRNIELKPRLITSYMLLAVVSSRSNRTVTRDITLKVINARDPSFYFHFSGGIPHISDFGRPIFLQFVRQTARCLQSDEFFRDLVKRDHLALGLCADVIAVAYVDRTTVEFFLADD
jgi:hypothetical protein